MSDRALRKAIRIVGNGKQKKLAAMLGVSCSVVNNWLNFGIKIPLKYALRIEELTEGLVKTEELTPDAKTEVKSYQAFLFKKFTERVS